MKQPFRTRTSSCSFLQPRLAALLLTARNFDSGPCRKLDWRQQAGKEGEKEELQVAVEKQEVEKEEVGEEEEEKVGLQVLREKVNLVRDGGKKRCQEKCLSSAATSTPAATDSLSGQL